MQTTQTEKNITNTMKTLATLALVALGTSGCGEAIDDPGNGKLEVQWLVAPRGCEQSEVKHIEVALSRDGLERRERISCTAQEGIVEGIEAEKYTVTLYGIDAQERETFISESKKVTINPDKTARVAEPMRLSARPASGVIEWRFGDGKVCGSHGVDEIDVVFYDQWDSEVIAQTFDCNDGLGAFEEIPAGKYQVYAQALGQREVDGEDVERRYKGVVDTTLGRGAKTQVELVLFEQVEGLK